MPQENKPQPGMVPVLSPRGIFLGVEALAGPFMASAAGAMLTAPGLVTWYRNLNQPFFTPPDSVFPLVWTLLYALMALAFWRILRVIPPLGQPSMRQQKGRAVGLFIAQLVFNVAWSWAFFWLQMPWAALGVLAILIGLVVATQRAFFTLDPSAGHALWPYLAWISFAFVLNAGFAFLN